MVAGPEAHSAFLPGRLALPLFMVCAAVVYRRDRSRSSWLLLGLALAADLALAPASGLGIPAPVTGYFVLIGMLHFVPGLLRWPVTAAVLGILQAWFMPIGWGGWELGILLGWFMLGRVAGDEPERVGSRLPGWLEPIGRRPLHWYIAHLVALVVAASL